MKKKLISKKLMPRVALIAIAIMTAGVTGCSHNSPGKYKDSEKFPVMKPPPDYVKQMLAREHSGGAPGPGSRSNGATQSPK